MIIDSSFLKLALVIWKDELFKACSRALISAILDEVEKERKGECISTSRLCTVINSLVELCITSESHPTASLNTSIPSVTARGHDSVLPTQVPSYNPADAHLEWRQGLPVYRDHFEQPFLRETVRYYETESSAYLSRHSVTDYLKWVCDKSSFIVISNLI